MKRIALLLALGCTLQAADPINIGSRRELFVDRFLIDTLSRTELRLQTPRDEGVAFKFDKPWEGLFSGYATIMTLEDGRLRAYYRGKAVANKDGSEEELTCCAESTDGRTWTKPELGIYEVMGTKQNNVVLMKAYKNVASLTRKLRAAGFSGILVSNYGLPDRKVSEWEEVERVGAPYLSTILARRG